MDDNARTLITLGVLCLCGVAIDAIGRRTRLPRVTLLLLLGFAIGASELDVLYPHAEKWFPVVIASTVFFEVVGPLLTRIGLVKAGEVHRGSRDRPE